MTLIASSKSLTEITDGESPERHTPEVKTTQIYPLTKNPQMTPVVKNPLNEPPWPKQLGEKAHLRVDGLWVILCYYSLDGRPLHGVASLLHCGRT